MTTDDRTLLVISGPTASGKTTAAIQFARKLQTEIISADSRQFFREIPIGTATPSAEELAAARHHFIGHLSIHDNYNVSRFETEVLDKLEALFSVHKTVVLVGGSGLYLNAVCHGIDELPDPDPAIRLQLKEMLATHGIGVLQEKLKLLDPDYAARVDLFNPARLIRALEVCITTGFPYSSLRTNVPKERSFRVRKLGLMVPREILNIRIENRVDGMIAAGLVDEARNLYPFRHLNALNTVGYKELFCHFDGTLTLDRAVINIKTNTRRYAKRQMTWLRKDPEITWIEPEKILEYLT
jgi:tRNA dimethylallyltransferase